MNKTYASGDYVTTNQTGSELFKVVGFRRDESNRAFAVVIDAQRLGPYLAFYPEDLTPEVTV